MSQFDDRASRIARLVFSARAADGLGLNADQLEGLIPRDPLGFFTKTFTTRTQSPNGDTHDFEVFADRMNGLYRGRITTTSASGEETQCVLEAHQPHDGFPLYRIDRLVIDNQAVDTKSLAAVRSALDEFVVRMNAGWPRPGQAFAIFPRQLNPLHFSLGTNSGNTPSPRGH